MPNLLLDPQVQSALGEARQAFVAVATRTGPHVTPELYALADGRLWMASAAGTLKVRVLGRHPAASAVITAGGRTVVVSGEVEAFDAHNPSDVARAMRQGPSVVRALASFGLRNAADLAGFLGDTVRGKTGVPSRRTLLALEPRRVALVDGGRLAGAWGDWPGPRVVDPAGTWTGEGVDAVVGWETAAGPVALPARWDADGSVASIPPGLAELAGLTHEAPACVVSDEYGRPGPAAKSGVLLRGQGRRSGGAVHLDTERVTAWDGVETSTVEAS